MLKLKVSGTRNDLKSFRKWLRRAATILPKYEVLDSTEFKQNSRDGKYYRYEADLLKPLGDEGGNRYVQSNRNSKSERWGWKNHYSNESWNCPFHEKEESSAD